MSVYVDQSKNVFRSMIMCHMIADSLEELHVMASAIGLARRWFQESLPVSFPHYDIAQSKRTLALHAGAIDCDRNTFVGHMRRIRAQGRPVSMIKGDGDYP